jgi:plasmid stabilization system protein ParE
MYRIAVTPKAKRDARINYEWLAERSMSGAEAWSAALSRALRALQDNPERHGLAPEGEDFDRPIRQFLFKTRRGRTYRGLFTIEGRVVRVLHIRGPGQRPLERDEL